jgi:hypothetical protein
VNTKDQRRVEALSAKATAIIDRSELENRGRTGDENIEIARLLKEIGVIRGASSAMDEVRRIGRQIGVSSDSGATADPNVVLGDGWAMVAEAIASKRQRHFEVPTTALLQKAAPGPRTKDLTSNDLIEGVQRQLPSFSVLGQDARFLYPHLPSTPVSGELSVSDFRQTGSRTVNGDVERELTATGEKATLDLEVSFFSEPLKQVAIVVEAIPNALLEGVSSLRTFLQTECQFQLSKAIDAHVVDAITFSDHPFDAEGSGPLTRIRNAVAAHRQFGYNPTIAAVSPATAAELDLTLTGGGYEFNVQRYGSSSPLFSLGVVEIPGLVDPFLIDPLAIGTLALGTTKVDVDQSSGFTVNTSTLRAEASVLFVLRNPQAIYEIGITS